MVSLISLKVSFDHLIIYGILIITTIIIVIVTIIVIIIDIILLIYFISIYHILNCFLYYSYIIPVF